MAALVTQADGVGRATDLSLLMSWFTSICSSFRIRHLILVYTGLGTFGLAVFKHVLYHLVFVV